MGKKRVCTTTEESDAEEVLEWKEEDATSKSCKWGKGKTYRGIKCKTEDEKKASKAIRMKKWKMAQKTDGAKGLAAK